MSNFCDPCCYVRDDTIRLSGDDQKAADDAFQHPRPCYAKCGPADAFCAIGAWPCILGLLRQKAAFGTLDKREDDVLSCLRCDALYPCVITDSCIAAVCCIIICTPGLCDLCTGTLPRHVINHQAGGTRSAISICIEDHLLFPCTCMCCANSAYVRRAYRPSYPVVMDKLTEKKPEREEKQGNVSKLLVNTAKIATKL